MTRYFFNSTVFLFSVYFFPRIVKFTMLCHTWYFLFINFQMRAAFFYSRAKLFITIRFGGGAYVVVWFYPWFKFYFLLFLGIVMYGNDFESKENKIWTRDIIDRLAKIMGFFDLWYDDSVIFFSSQVWVKAQLHVTWNIYTDERSEWKYNDITNFLLLWITFLHDDLRGIASEHLNMLLECKCSLR